MNPWDLLEQQPKWWIGSNNSSGYLKKINYDSVYAILIMQDCNQSGEYFRHFWWKNGDEKRYFDVERENVFKRRLTDIQVGEVVTVQDNSFIVKEFGDSAFIKLFVKEHFTE